MKFFCYQLNDGDCGFACLKMLLANLNNNKNYLYLPNSKEEGNYTMLELVNEAKKYDLCLDGYRCETLNDVTLPIICMIEGMTQNHFVVVYKIKNNQVYCLDPNIGRVKMKYSAFLRRYKGVFLAVNKFSPQKYKSPYHYHFPIIPFVMFLISGILLTIISFCFQNNSILLFSILIVLLLLEQVANGILKMETLSFVKKMLHIPKINQQTFLKISSNFVMYYSLPLKLLEKIMIFVFLFVSALSILNMYHILTLMLCLIIMVIFLKHINKKENKLSQLEKQIFINDTLKSVYIRELNRFMRLKNVSTFLTYLFMAICYVIIYFVGNETNLLNIIYPLLGSGLIINSFTHVLEMMKQYKKRAVFYNINNTILKNKY